MSCGTVTATDTFNLASSIYKISEVEGDTVRIVWASDSTKYTDYDVVSPSRLKYYASGAVSGGNGHVAKVGSTLKFATPFVSTDKEFGGTIYVPAYTLPATLVNDTDVISVDIPEWLVTRVAAEYTFTSLVLQYRYPNLLNEANDLMKKMIENNDAQADTVVKRQAAIGRIW